MKRMDILKLLNAQININGHIIGAVASSGITAKFASLGGVDILLALSAGKFRMMGRSSYSSYFCYESNNQIVMDMGIRELLPIIGDVPVIFGLFANDPLINMYEFLKEIKGNGFAGIVNFPTIALIDGQFREALEEDGNTFEKELEAIKLAHFLDLFTIGFVTNEKEARLMAEAGADIVCAHLGLTKGGYLGAKKYISLEQARKTTEAIFNASDATGHTAIKMIYGGPANNPIDMQYFYKNTKCQGYFGGSTFDRVPIERAVYNTAKAFKSCGNFNADDPINTIINSHWDSKDYVNIVKKYIEEYYMSDVHLSDLALVSHVSSSYLSTKFKKEVGCSFTEYLIQFRMNKAKELLANKNIKCHEVASMVGYSDSVQFSKIFKKYIGTTPSLYKKDNINTTK